MLRSPASFPPQLPSTVYPRGDLRQGGCPSHPPLPRPKAFTKLLGKNRGATNEAAVNAPIADVCRAPLRERRAGSRTKASGRRLSRANEQRERRCAPVEPSTNSSKERRVSAVRFGEALVSLVQPRLLRTANNTSWPFVEELLCSKRPRRKLHTRPSLAARAASPAGRRSVSFATRKAYPNGAIGVLFRPCVESGPEVATNDVAKAGVSRCQLGVEVRAKSMSERERRRHGVPTPESFRGRSSWKATRGGTGVCQIHESTTGVVTGGDATRLRRPRAGVEEPLFGTR